MHPHSTSPGGAYPRAIAISLSDDAFAALSRAVMSLGGETVRAPRDGVLGELEGVGPASSRNGAAVALRADLVAVDAADTEFIRETVRRRSAGVGDGALLAIADVQRPATLIDACAAGADDAVTADVLAGDAGELAVEKALAIASRRRSRDGLEIELRRAAETAQRRADGLAQRVTTLESEAWTDPLTGLANRRQLAARMDRMFAEAVRYGADLACVMLDLDGFKGLNDTLGHNEGDACLKRVARAINESVRASDVAARYGGDEFVLLMPRTPVDEAARVAERLRQRFLRKHDATGDMGVGISIGVSSVEATRPLNGDGLIDAADRAMYASKAGGGREIMVCRLNGEMVSA